MMEHKHILLISMLLMAGLLVMSCKPKKQEDHSEHRVEVDKEEYRCPMHPEIIRNEPGNCPICGMQLEKKEKDAKVAHEISLNTLLRPTNAFVLSSLPMITARYSEEPIETDVFGYTAYNTSSIGVIAARAGGRIEKLYVKFRFQKISKGQKIMDIYSPELLTAQQNLLFLLRNDPGNTRMISAAREKLLLLGFGEKQLEQVIQSREPSLTVAVYSNYPGHIHEAMNMPGRQADDISEMSNAAAQTTQELTLKEGMYVKKGQTIFSVYNPTRLWILLNIYPQDQAFVKPGDNVRIVPEAKPGSDFRANINYIEPFFRKGSKTIAARVNFDNSQLQLPIGSQVKATIFSGLHKAIWLPKEAVLTLGLDKVVFLKTGDGFRSHLIRTGHAHGKLIQVTGGLELKDSVAANAQYLVDSESFVKITGSGKRGIEE
jgi:membrane fusion protein, copper/silver efflux system